MRIRALGTSLAAAMLLVPATAMAVDYPPPTDPGKPGKRPTHTKTLKVCKKGKNCFKTIQKAVDKAHKGDTIKVAAGTYKAPVKISGSKKAYLRLIGNPKKPRSVVIDLKSQKGAKAQNGVLINSAPNVEVSGFYLKNYRANGVFAVNTSDYDMNHLVAGYGGGYGLYAFNSKGGRMTDSEAFYNNDSGYYVGQTPPQTKPKRTFAKNLVAWGNVIGWSGTNMRYTTITKSVFYDNAVGVVPNALDSEKFQPAEDNVIADNDVFWNNFNYRQGAPFKYRPPATGFDYPPGTGIVLLGGRRILVQNNRVYGNWLTGISTLRQFILEQQDAADTIGNKIEGNKLGLGGSDLNGYDEFYDGSGSDNCWIDNDEHSPSIPEDKHTFANCPFTGQNAFDQQLDSLVIGWVADPPGAHWVRHDHAAKPGYNPLENWTPSFDPGSAVGGP
jgi:Periplasmic copper-binding protein (NosD)